MNPVKNFQIEDIDGCEFVLSKTIGKMMISWHHDFDGYETGKIHVVYPDASHKAIEEEEAQKRLDSGEWTVYRYSKEDNPCEHCGEYQAYCNECV